MKIALLGYGKMGKTIEQLAEAGGHQIVYRRDTQRSSGDLQQAEVAIDFSTPDAAVGHIQMALDAGLPIVSGTTGWLDRYDEMIKLCEARNGSFLHASNFSVGVNLFFALNRKLGALMQGQSGYKASMEEIHHTQKLDAPSGTAISLANDLLPFLGTDHWKLDDEAGDGLPIKAVREGDVKGTHIIRFESEVDRIQIEHQAYSREGFAQGAIVAASWLMNKKGVYSMADVLGIK